MNVSAAIADFLLRGVVAVAGLLFGDILHLYPQPPQVLPEGLPDRYVNSVGMEMQFIPAGTFVRGSDRKVKSWGGDREIWRWNEGQEFLACGPAREVSVDAFYIARLEVSRGQFEEFARETGGTDRFPVFNEAIRERRVAYAPLPPYPVTTLDWYTANEFCRWLSEREGRTYRLPTEAEWEYAARGGVEQEPWYGGKAVRFAEHVLPDRAGPWRLGAPAGSFMANPMGLHDMVGNAPEWTSDWCSGPYDRFDRKRNPDGPWWGNWLGRYKVMRGGMYPYYAFGGSRRGREVALPTEQAGGIRLVAEIDESFPLPPAEPPTTTAPPVPTVEPGRVYETWEIAEGIELKMVWIPACRFILGAPEEEGEWTTSPLERPQTPVVITKGFFMGIYEVTQEQYGALMGEHESLCVGPKRPVDRIAGFQGYKFCDKLTAKLQADGTLPEGSEFMLPEEPEWEYAARAGTQTAYFFGSGPELLVHYAWFDVLGGTREVGQKLPNPWGLYDIYGNVAEKCKGMTYELGYSLVGGRPRELPAIDARTGRAVESPIRGGSWCQLAHRCRSASRHTAYDSREFPIAGFRVIRRLGPNEVPPTPSIDRSTIQRYPEAEFPWDEFRKEIGAVQ